MAVICPRREIIAVAGLPLVSAFFQDAGQVLVIDNVEVAESSEKADVGSSVSYPGSPSPSAASCRSRVG